MSKEIARQKVYSVVIPAWNEERTIEELIRTCKAHPLCHEVVVVSDGSTDRTAEVAQKAGAVVVELAKNAGKGEAMDEGVQKAKMDVIFFSDADILGLDSLIISSIAAPVLLGRYAMSIGIQGR